MTLNYLRSTPLFQHSLAAELKPKTVVKRKTKQTREMNENWRNIFFRHEWILCHSQASKSFGKALIMFELLLMLIISFSPSTPTHKKGHWVAGKAWMRTISIGGVSKMVLFLRMSFHMTCFRHVYEEVVNEFHLFYNLWLCGKIDILRKIGNF